MKYRTNPRSHVERTNRHQFHYMARFMAAHPAFARNNWKCLIFEYDRSLHKKKWEHLTAKLNALGPPSRAIEAWKKLWISYKAKVKSKLYFNKKTMEQNPTKYHQLKFILTPDELIVKKFIEGDPTDEAYVINNSPPGSNTTDESSVVESENTDFMVTTDATILKPKLGGTTLSSAKYSTGNLTTSLPTTSQADNNIKSIEEENEEIKKHLDKLKRKRRKISDEIVDLKRRDLELKEKLHELKEQTLKLKFHNVEYKAQQLELKRKELRMKETVKCKNQ